MADTQAAIYGQAYSQNIMQLAQQKYSKLNGTVYMKPNVRGKAFFQDQIGQWNMALKAGRNSQTPNNDPNLGRRMGLMLDYNDNRLLDRTDELKVISDPRSAYTIAAAQSLGRQMDDSIIQQGLLGVAYSGETGANLVTNGNIVLASSASMTLARIIAVKQQFDIADVEMEDRFFVIRPDALDNLLNTTAATSSDYNSVKALIRGEIDSWMGFKWIMSTRISAASNSTLIGIAYQRYGVCLAMADNPIVRTDERTDLSYSWQVYYELNIGAVRLEEARVVILNEG
jgi:hypothetical protein